MLILICGYTCANTAHIDVAASSPTLFYAARYLYFPEKLSRRVFIVLFSFIIHIHTHTHTHYCMRCGVYACSIVVSKYLVLIVILLCFVLYTKQKMKHKIRYTFLPIQLAKEKENMLRSNNGLTAPQYLPFFLFMAIT